jgi:N-glycosylase/DNA lyase
MIAKITDDKTIEVYDLTQFDTDAIMHSGQVFRYFEIDGGYRLVVGSNYAEITKLSDKCIIKCNNAKYFWKYFDLNTDYNEIKKEFSGYESIKRILNNSNAGGIRILHGEFVEIVISFIISANNSIKRFTKTLNLLCEQFGTKLESGYFAFPTLEQLSKVTVADFQAIGCGYRSPHLVKAIQQMKSLDVEILQQLDNVALSKDLQCLAGVGPKVCFCALLYCGNFHRLDKAPQDTWIRKALEQLPQSDKEVLLDHKYAGVAQQYIFYYLQFKKEKL